MFKDDIAVRAGVPGPSDLIAASVGMIVLGTAVYRALGLPLVVVASVFVLYVFFGHSELLPDAIRWKGASFGKAMWHYWIQTEGVFGVALGVSASMIFLFVLFGGDPGEGGGGQLLHQALVLAARPLPRRAGQGRGGRLGDERDLLRLVDREHRDHRDVHHPADEAHRLLRGEGGGRWRSRHPPTASSPRR